MEKFNYEEKFAQSIGIKEPWYIEQAKFDEEKREIHIYVKARKTGKYPCPKCGELNTRYDDEETERTWRHGDVVFFPCYIHCRRPRIKCGKEIHVVTAPWARPGNAIAEGINSLIQSAKRRARGFRTYIGYECMIYLVVGKLHLDCPPIFS